MKITETYLKTLIGEETKKIFNEDTAGDLEDMAAGMGSSISSNPARAALATKAGKTQGESKLDIEAKNYFGIQGNMSITGSNMTLLQKAYNLAKAGKSIPSNAADMIRDLGGQMPEAITAPVADLSTAVPTYSIPAASTAIDNSSKVKLEQENGNELNLTVNVGNISSPSLASTTAANLIRKFMAEKYPKYTHTIPRLVPDQKDNNSVWKATVALQSIQPEKSSALAIPTTQAPVAKPTLQPNSKVKHTKSGMSLTFIRSVGKKAYVTDGTKSYKVNIASLTPELQESKIFKTSYVQQVIKEETAKYLKEMKA